MKYIYWIILCLIGSHVMVGQSSGDLHITVTNLRNDNGQVGIRLFDQKKGFPAKRDKALNEFFVIPENGEAKFEIKDLEYGVYAIGAIHDENENKEIDKKFLGIPKEGFGTTNNPKIVIGPPSFKKAKFEFSDDGQSVTIRIKYF